MKRRTQILSGNFAGEGSKGNFNGYNLDGERIFVAKKQIEALGIKKDADFKPFYAMVDEREFNNLDDNQQPTGTTFKRLQALSVFKTREEFISAMNSDKLLDIDAAKELKAAATTAGLTEVQLNAILTASI